MATYTERFEMKLSDFEYVELSKIARSMDMTMAAILRNLLDQLINGQIAIDNEIEPPAPIPGDNLIAISIQVDRDNFPLFNLAATKHNLSRDALLNSFIRAVVDDRVNVIALVDPEPPIISPLVR